MSHEILPADKRLDASVAMFFDDIVESLASHYEQHGTFVDDDIEDKNPRLVWYVYTLSNKLLRACIKDDEPTRTDEVIAFRIAHEAFFFAYKASEFVMPNGVRPRVYAKDYFKGDSEYDKLQKIVGGGQEYLQRREHIDSLIALFIAELDPTVSYPQIAEAVASMTFNHIENGIREQFISEQETAFSEELETFIEQLESE